MKNQLPFGSLDLPDDWEDRSTYQFVSPPEKDMDLPLLVGKGISVEGERFNVVVSRMPVTGSLTLEKVIREQSEAFRTALTRCKIISTDSWQHPRHGSVPALQIEFELLPNQPLRQVHLYFARDTKQDVITLTFTCAAHSYGRRETELKRIFDGFELN